MPSLLQGRCDSCGHATAVVVEEYGAVLVDRAADAAQHEVAGAVLEASAKGHMATVEDPRFVVLTHPIESLVLAGTGYGRTDLVRQGRYVATTNVVCRRCGTVFPRRRLDAPPGTGCLVATVAGLAAGICIGLTAGGFMAGCGGGVAVAAAVAFVLSRAASWYVRRRFARRAAGLEAGRACPSCGADDAAAVREQAAVRCPGCGRDTLAFRFVGKS